MPTGLPHPGPGLVFFPSFQQSTEELGLGGLGGNPETVPFYVAAPVARILYFYSGQDNEPAGALFGNPDEDQILQRCMAIQPFIQRYPQPYSYDSSAVGLYGIPDENERWTNPVSPCLRPYAYPQQYAYETNDIVPSLPGDDDQNSPRVIYPIGGRYPQPWAYDLGSGSLTGTPDEYERWVNPYVPCVWKLLYPQPWLGDEQTPVLAGLPDEDSLRWSVVRLNNAVRWLQPWFDGDLVQGTGVPDENELWRNPLARVEWLFKYPQQWVFDDQTPSLSGLPDEDSLAWHIAQLVTGNRSLLPWFDDGNVQLTTISDEELIWQNPLYHNGFQIQYLQQWPLEANDLTPQFTIATDDDTHVGLVRWDGPRYVQPWAFDTGSVTLYNVPADEVYRWHVLQLVPQYKPPFIQGAASDVQLFVSVPDDDARWNVIQKLLPWLIPQPWFDGGPVQIARLDDSEHVWINPLKRVGFTIAGLQQYPFDDQTPALGYAVEEEFWQNMALYHIYNERLAQRTRSQAIQVMNDLLAPYPIYAVEPVLRYITRMNDWLDLAALHRSVT